MAELNFGLLTPPGSQSIGNAFVQGMDQAAVARAQENQNALAQYTLGKAKREDQQQNELYAAVRQPGFKLDIGTAMRFGAPGLAAYKAQQDADKNAVDIAYTQAKTGAIPATTQNTKAETAVRHGTVMKTEATRVLADPTFDNAMQAVVNFGKATGQDVTQELATITAIGNDPVKIATWAKGHAVTGEQLLNQNKPPDVARLIAYRDSLPLGRDRDAVTAMIEKASNENYQYNSSNGTFELRQGGGAAPASPAFVDRGIAQGVTPLLQAPSVDEARRQAFAMNAAGLPVNIRSGNALPGAQPQPLAMPPPAVAAAAALPLNPRQIQTQFETGEKIRESESEAIGKLRVDEYKQLGADALSARKSTQGIDAAERILNSGFNTGFGTETQAAAANILASLGVPDAKNYATNAQLFLAQARTITNDRLLAQKGVQTDNDFKRTEETGARLGNTVDANKFLLAVNRAINKQTIEKHNFFTKWESKNDSLRGAEQAWQDSPAGGASLFDRPELKQYAQVKPAAATPTTTAKPAAPAVGAVQDGYRFKGGDPAKVGNWEKVTP